MPLFLHPEPGVDEENYFRLNFRFLNNIGDNQFNRLRSCFFLNVPTSPNEQNH